MRRAGHLDTHVRAWLYAGQTERIPAEARKAVNESEVLISPRVRSEDHAAYTELARRIDRGERLGKSELDRLDALLRTSPDLLAAYALGADIARFAGDFDRARDYATRAHQLTPHDPGPLGPKSVTS